MQEERQKEYFNDLYMVSAFVLLTRYIKEVY